MRDKKELEQECLKIVEFIQEKVEGKKEKDRAWNDDETEFTHKSDGVVLGLSGGLDSAVVAMLCAKALGKNKVHCIIMPSGKVNNEDTKIAVEFCIRHKFHYHVVLINDLVSHFENILPIGVSVTNQQLCTGNMCARIRMTILYYYANLENKMVVGTGNKSEEMTGYFTKYGDGGVDFLPIAHLFKTEVRTLARIIGVPEMIIQRPPSAGLWVGQTDEGELGISYKALDTILEVMEYYGCESQTHRLNWDVMHNYRVKRLKLPGKKIVEIIARYKNSEHKRNLPPSMEG